MPSFGRTSTDRLTTCDDKLQRLFNTVIRHYDCSVLEGHRPLPKQKQLFENGKTKVLYGKHNESPAKATDAAPYINGGIPWPKVPDDWNNKAQRQAYIKDLAQFYHFAGYVQGTADVHMIPIRWGGDWDMDHDLRDNSFDDLVHFELT